MNNSSILIGLFYKDLKSLHLSKYPSLENRLAEEINRQPATIQQMLSQMMAHQQSWKGEENYLLGFHLCWLKVKDVKKALLFFILAQIQANQNSIQQMVAYYETIQSLQVNSCEFCKELSQHNVKDWRIYQLLSQLMVVENNIQDSIQPLHKVIDLTKGCEYAYLELAFIYSLLMQSQYAYIYLKMFKSLNNNLSQSFCQCEIAILILCEQYETCLERLNNCHHQYLFKPILRAEKDAIVGNIIQNKERNEKCKDQIDGAIRTLKVLKHLSKGSFHQYYQLIKFNLTAKNQIVQHLLFLLINNQISLDQRSLNQKILTMSQYLKMYDLSYHANLLKSIEQQIDKESQENIRRQILGIKTKYNISFKQQIKYRIYYEIAFSYHVTYNEKASDYILLYCKKALDISSRKKIVQVNKDSYLYALSAKFTLITQGKSAQVLKLCEKAVSYSQNFYYANGLEIVIQIYYSIKQFHKSLRLAKLSTQLGNKSPKILYILSLSYFKCNQIQSSIEFTKSLIKNNPDVSLYYYGLGQIYSNIGQSDDALNAFQMALSLLEKDKNHLFYLHLKSAIFNQIGLVYKRTNLNSKAVQYFSLAIQLNNYQSLVSLGQIYDSQMRFEELKNVFSEKIPNKANQCYYQIMFILGSAYMNLQSHEKALACFQQQNSPQMAMQFAGRAHIYYLQKNYTKALQNCQQVIQFNHEYISNFIILAAIYFESKSKEIQSNIIKILKQLEETHSSNISVIFGLLYFKALIGQRLSSVKYLEKYLNFFNKQYQNKGQISLEMQKKIKQNLNYLLMIKIQQGLFKLQLFLLYRLLNDKTKCKQYIENLCTLRQNLLFRLFLQIQACFTQKQKISEILIASMLKYNHNKGITAARISVKLQILSPQICYMLVNAALKQVFVCLEKTAKFLQLICQNRENVQKQSKQESYQSQILSNIKQIWKYYVSLQNFSKLQSKQLENSQFQRFIDELKKQNFIRIIKVPSLSSALFLKIRFQQMQIKEEILKIIQQYEKEKKKKKIILKTIKLIQRFLSQKHLKNQLIKYIFELTYNLSQYLDPSTQQQLLLFLTNFKEKNQLNFDYITELTLSKIFSQQSIQPSEICFSQKEQISQPNSIITLTLQQPCGEYLSAESKNPLQKLKRIYKIQNLKFLPNQRYKYFEYQKQILINDKFQIADINRTMAFLLFKNCFDLMYQLQEQGTQYIAKYKFCDEWSEEIIKKKQFQYLMDEGEQIYSYHKQISNQSLMKECIKKSNEVLNRIVINGKQLEQQDIKIVDYLWREGPLEIIKFTLCLIKGIKELNKFHIIHLDLEPRNIIKVGLIYKIMDFDNAFRYARKQNPKDSKDQKQSSKDYKSYKNLQNIVTLMIQINKITNKNDLENIISYIFRQIEDQEKQQLINLCFNNSKSQAAEKIIGYLSKYAKQYHLKQFKRIIVFFNVESIMGKYFKQFRFWTNQYCNQKIQQQSLIKKLQHFLKQK